MAYLQQINMMEVTAEEFSVCVNVHEGFATVAMSFGSGSITLFTANEDEARAIVAKFLMPRVNDRTPKASQTV